MEFESEIEIKNPLTQTIKLYLEPWGEELEMSAGAKFVIKANANKKGIFEVDYANDKIFVYAWSGATVNVFCDGAEIGGSRSVVPEIPEGFKTSTFLNFMFGKKDS